MNLLKCTSTYPATPDNTNIQHDHAFEGIVSCEVGLSDHTMGIGAAVASVALVPLSLRNILPLSGADGGVDSSFSMEPEEIKSLVV